MQLSSIGKPYGVRGFFCVLVAVRNGETKFLSATMVLDDMWLFSLALALAPSSVSLTPIEKASQGPFAVQHPVFAPRTPSYR
jgi:hypothetical protein